MRWSSTDNSAVTEAIAAREARPDSPTSAEIGAPITTHTLTGWIILAWRGITPAEPPIPIGMIGTPALAAT